MRFIDSTAQYSGQSLDNVNWTHLVLASGRLLLQKKSSLETWSKPELSWCIPRSWLASTSCSRRRFQPIHRSEGQRLNGGSLWGCKWPRPRIFWVPQRSKSSSLNRTLSTKQQYSLGSNQTEHRPHDPEVVGLNPAGCGALNFYFLNNVSLIRSLEFVELTPCKTKKQAPCGGVALLFFLGTSGCSAAGSRTCLINAKWKNPDFFALSSDQACLVLPYKDCLIRARILRYNSLSELTFSNKMCDRSKS